MGWGHWGKHHSILLDKINSNFFAIYDNNSAYSLTSGVFAHVLWGQISVKPCLINRACNSCGLSCTESVQWISLLALAMIPSTDHSYWLCIGQSPDSRERLFICFWYPLPSHNALSSRLKISFCSAICHPIYGILFRLWGKISDVPIRWMRNVFVILGYKHCCRSMACLKTEFSYMSISFSKSIADLNYGLCILSSQKCTKSF